MKKLKLNLERLGEELEILDPVYLTGIKGGFGNSEQGGSYGGYSSWEDLWYAVQNGYVPPEGTYSPGGDYGGFGYWPGYGGTPGYPINLDPVPVGGYGNYGSNGGWWTWPNWSGYGNGSGGYYPSGGDNGGNSSSSFMSRVQAFFSSHTAEYVESVIDNTGLANGIQSLSHSAINQLVVCTGGQPVTILKDIASKTGLGRICAVGAIYQGLETIVAFTDGDITTDDWKDLGMELLNVASFVPGPIGVVATGINVGFAVYGMVGN